MVSGRVTDSRVARACGTDRLDALYRASGGNLANAARFLDAARYAESRCAFLACRALDAFEDLAGKPHTALEGIRQVVAYLTQQSDALPDAARLHPARYSDELECEAVRALPELRVALESLDAAARLRVSALIDLMAAAMARQLEDGSRRRLEHYGAAVLGSACAYVFRLLAVNTYPPADFAAMGTLLQAANDLRDLEFDRRASHQGRAAERELQLNLIVAEMAPQVLGCLGQVRFARCSRSRGAIAHLILTTAHFFMRRSGLVRAGLVQCPLLGGLLATASQAVYERALLEGEELIHDCIVRGCMNWPGNAAPQVTWRNQPLRRSRLQSIFEERMIVLHPDPARARLLGHGSKLLHAALRLCRELPATPLESGGVRGPDAAILMVSDYLLACAIGRFSLLGPDTVMEVGVSAAALACTAESGSGPGDVHGEIARLLSTLVGRARDLSVEQVKRNARRDQDYAARLHSIDRAPWWRARAKARRALLSGMPAGEPGSCQ